MQKKRIKFPSANGSIHTQTKIKLINLLNSLLHFGFVSFSFGRLCDWVDIVDDAARQALDWGLMELQEFLEDEELALGVKGEGPGESNRNSIYFIRSPLDDVRYQSLFTLNEKRPIFQKLRRREHS